MTQAAARQNEDVYKYEILTSGHTKRFHIQYNPQKIDWHMPQAHTRTHTHIEQPFEVSCYKKRKLQLNRIICNGINRLTNEELERRA